MKTWIISEGLAGTENQCLGVAKALGVEAEVKHIGLRQPWKALSPYFGFEQSWSFTGGALEAPWPELVIAAGRKAIPAARYIKRQNPQTFVAFLQSPRVPCPSFDIIAVPEHDDYAAPNVIRTHLAPNLVTPETLEAAKSHFKLLDDLPQPRVAILIGGDSKAYAMDEQSAQEILIHIQALAEQDCGLMITTSRRTPEGFVHQLQKLADRHANVYLWDGRSENPYFGFLAYADYILVTFDSVSMMADACTTGKPVYLLPLTPRGEGKAAKMRRVQDTLIGNGMARYFDGNLNMWTYESLNDAGKVAEFIKMKLLLR